jgi:rfaE bifunctional protein nucleotidyltransferase chain/domain
LKKLYSLSQLKKIISAHKKRGRKIVLANGCFDLIHVGHIRYLSEAKKRGDILVVALNSDASVHKLKGKGRPILNQKERAEIISSFSFVDYITFFNETNVARVLLALKPDFHAKGSDYTAETVPEKQTVKEYGGKIVITGGPKIKSTSQVIKEMALRIRKKRRESVRHG